MIGPLLWLIYLLTYSDTKRALFGSRQSVWCQWFGVNVGFSEEDRTLIENLYFLKVVEQQTY